jgi:hypothetical protein
MCHTSILDFGFRIEMPSIANRQSPILLEFFDLDLRETLTVTLFAFVLFAAFLFENDDFIAFAVPDDRRLNGRAAAEFSVFAFADDERFEIDASAFFGFD